MNKYIKVLSVMLVLSSSVFLSSANAASYNNTANSTDMLITIAETNPVLVDRLNDIALNEPKLLQQIMQLADSDAEQLERLLDLAEYRPELLAKMVTIKTVAAAQKLNVEEEQVSKYGQVSTRGIIKDGTINR